MAKLRKMLGRADDPQIVTLMHLIETQSKPTLAAWAAACVQERYLPVYERAYPNDRRMRELIEAIGDHLHGALKLPQLKILLRQARAIPQEAEGDPAAQAAARAVVTACGVIQTPTNALGFVFYGAAAAAYDALGLSAAASEYDTFAAAEFEALAASLRAAAVPDEVRPAKINWNC